MKTQTFSTLSQTVLLAAAAAAASAPSFAQNAPAAQTIEVTAPRADVRTVCRSVDEQLQDMLGGVAPREAEAGTIEVRFELEGARVAALHTSGGPLAYRMATHRAVRSLECNAGGGARSVRMQVVFLDRETSAQRERVALRSEGQSFARR